MTTHSSVLAWRIPGTGEPGGLPSMGSHRVGHDWSNLAVAVAADSSTNTKLLCYSLKLLKITSVTIHVFYVYLIVFIVQIYYAGLGFITQSCLTLCNPMDCSLPGSSVHGDFPGKNTGVGCLALLQGIFLTQRSDPGLPHCRQILYHLNHQGSSQHNDLHLLQKDYHNKFNTYNLI